MSPSVVHIQGGVKEKHSHEGDISHVSYERFFSLVMTENASNMVSGGV